MTYLDRRDPLAGTRPAFMPDPRDPVDPVRRERDLRAILAQPRPARTRPPIPWRRVQSITVGAVAVLVAVVAVTTTTRSDSPEGGPGMSPRQVLLAAAEATTQADTPTSGRYWHLRSRSTSVHLMWRTAAHDEYHMVNESGDESWISRTGADDSVSVYSIDFTSRPLTERDRTEWEKAGNPAGIPDASPAPGVPPAPPMPMPIPPDAVWQSGELEFAIGEANMPLHQVLALPTDPERLKTLLLDRFRAQSSTGEGPRDETDWLTWEAVSLLGGKVPTTSGTRAAAYRLLADLPGFRVMDRAELPDGATVGLSREVRSNWSHLVENALVDRQVIIDPDTGSLREERLVLLAPGTEKRPLPVGTVLYAETVERVGWVDTEPVLPPGIVQYGPEGGR
jgi:hypothetical protein